MTGKIPVERIQQDHVQAARLVRRNIRYNVGRQPQGRLHQRRLRMLKAEVTDLLRLSVFQYGEVVRCKPGDRLTVAVGSNYVNDHQTRIRLQDWLGVLGAALSPAGAGHYQEEKGCNTHINGLHKNLLVRDQHSLDRATE